MLKMARIRIVVLTIAFCIPAFHQSAWALSCGNYRYPRCDGPDLQYAAGFNPHVGYGGFGGGICRAQRTPVIFVHGNGDRATNWDSPVTVAIGNHAAPVRSVYQEFKARGYTDCELFGITYLSASEQGSPQANYHKPEKYGILMRFVEAVKSYTGKDQVDVVAHSMGVSMMLAALTYQDDVHAGKNGWSSVRRFVNIAGGVRGLPACIAAGFMNSSVSTCGSQNVINEYVFGFYPDSRQSLGFNRWTGGSGRLSMRRAPSHHPEVSFYTISAGLHDQVHCSTAERHTDCGKGALFMKSTNVKAQLDVGAGSKARKVNLDFRDWRPTALSGGDADGIGHFKVRNNTGQIIYEMLNSDCTGAACRGDYGGPVSAVAE
jgi:pimeloyl-ACP methyl ester carboxylesterase